MKQQRGEHEVKRDEGGPGSSHQGGGHGRAHRERDDHGPVPDERDQPRPQPGLRRRRGAGPAPRARPEDQKLRAEAARPAAGRAAVPPTPCARR